MNLLNIVQGGAGFIGGLGAAKLAEEAIKKITPKVTSKLDKVLVKVGEFAIVGVVSIAAGDFVEGSVRNVIDTVTNTVNDVKTKIEEMKGEKEEVTPKET